MTEAKLKTHMTAILVTARKGTEQQLVAAIEDYMTDEIESQPDKSTAKHRIAETMAGLIAGLVGEDDDDDDDDDGAEWTD